MSVLNVKSLSAFQCKCAQYWPDQGCWTYGNIRVSVEDTMVLVDYTIRKFCIQQVNIYIRVGTGIKRFYSVFTLLFSLQVLVFSKSYQVT